MLKQSFEDQFSQLDKDLDKSNANEAEFTTSLEVGEVDLWMLSCAQVAFDHVASVTAFAEGLKALAVATQAARQERALSRARSAHIAHFRNHDVGAGTGEEPFAKVKGLVTDLIKKLKAEASSEASEAEELKALADATKAVRQERVLFRARPARFAHPEILMLVLD